MEIKCVICKIFHAYIKVSLTLPQAMDSSMQEINIFTTLLLIMFRIVLHMLSKKILIFIFFLMFEAVIFLDNNQKKLLLFYVSVSLFRLSFVLV